MSLFGHFVSALSGARARAVTAAAAALITVGCNPITSIGESIAPEPVAGGEAIGSGSVKVALLLPLSGSGNAGETARALKNAAEMALSDIPNSDLQLVPYDTRGTADGAQSAARAAVAAQSRLIIGPIFATEVRAAGGIARQAQIPIIAFSTDTNVASQGIYLLSFLPETDINRIVGHAVRNGKRSFAALLPENAYGSVVEAAFQQAVSLNNGRVVAIERYQPNQEAMQAAVDRIAAVAAGNNPQVDALLVPDGPAALQALGPMLAGRGVASNRVQLLGSGQWNDASAWRIAELSGGWFAGPDPSGWQNFSARYASRYGSPPSRNATLAYDAVSLAAALGRMGESAYRDATLTSSDGFAGIDGVFRFRANGTNERGLSVLEVRDGASRVREQPPRAFSSGT